MFAARYFAKRFYADRYFQTGEPFCAPVVAPPTDTSGGGVVIACF